MASTSGGEAQHICIGKRVFYRANLPSAAKPELPSHLDATLSFVVAAQFKSGLLVGLVVPRESLGPT